MFQPIRLLLVEDDADDAELLIHRLRREGFAPDWKRVQSGAALQSALKIQTWDIVISDYQMPGFSGEAVLEIVRAWDADLPIIIVSGAIGEETAVDLMRGGASDFVLKQNLARLPLAVGRELRQAESGRLSRRLAPIVQSTEDALIETSPAGIIEDWNPAAQALYGWSNSEIVGHPVSLLMSTEDQAEHTQKVDHILRTGRAEQFESVRIRKDGSRFSVLVKISPICSADGQIIGLSRIHRDLTQQKRAEQTRARDSLLLSNVRDSVIVTDPNGIVTYWNDGATRVFGWTVEEMLGRPLIERFPESERAWIAETIQKIAESREWNGEYQDWRKDGSRVWVDARVSRIVDREGQVLGVMGIAHDISERKQAEETLRASEHRYRMLVESIPNMVWMTDAAGEVDYLNSRAEERLGIPAKSIFGWNWLDLVHPEDRETAREAWQAAIVSDGGEYWNEYRVRTADESYRWYLAKALPLRGEDGSTRRWIGTWTDIDDLKLSEEKLKRTGELLNTVAKNTTDAVFVKDRQGRYLLFNEAAARFVGRPVEEVIGRDDTALFGPEDARFVMDRDRRIMESGQAETEEEPLTAAGVRRIYLATKAPFRDSEGRVAGLIGISRDITERKEAEETLRLRDRAVQAATEGIIITDPLQPDNPIIYVSPGFERLTGYSASEILGRNCRFLQGPDTDPDTRKRVREAVAVGQPVSVELLNYRKDGTPFWNRLSISPVRDENGKLAHFVGVQNDVSERRQLEEQFRLSQKMEAIGQLAGGIAHDFNNLLTIINGYTSVLLEETSPEHAFWEPLDEIRKAGERSANLTRQLLAFSRRQMLAMEVLDVNAVVSQMEKMLKRLIGEHIEFAASLAPDLRPVKADAGQLEQILLNLAVNARDAMPTGGKLTIETQNVEWSQEDARTRPDREPGSYVMLSVKDTGCGMSPDVQAQIFEPFYTTKKDGGGTGLGLSVVHGIVMQSDGHLEVVSEPGAGSTFKILLPRLHTPEPRVDEPADPHDLPKGTETILLVEDEDGVRSLEKHLLERLGYTILDAADGTEARRLVESHADTSRPPIQLLVTDVVMPRESGPQIAEWMLNRDPGMRVLFLSGYTDDTVLRHGVLNSEVNYLQKPFTPAEFATKVRAALDKPQ